MAASASSVLPAVEAPDGVEATVTDLVESLTELDAAAPAYEEAMTYYLNESPERFASDATARKLAGTADRYRVNCARTPVDAVVDRLLVAQVKASRADGGDWEDADTALHGMWDVNQLGTQVPRLLRDTSIYGDGYLFVWPGPRSGVTCAYNSPLQVRVIYDTENDLVPLHMVKRWKGRDGTEYANLITAAESVRYELDRKGDWRKPGNWSEVSRAGHDLGRLPVEHLATWAPYGRPEHKDAYGPQDAVNKLASTMVHAGEALGYPARYVLMGADASVRGDRLDSLDFDDEFDQDMTRGRQPGKLRVGPGEVATLEGAEEAGQWSAAESRTFIDAANWFLRVLAFTTVTPPYLLDTATEMSGIARRYADAPLEVKVGQRRSIYEARIASGLALGLHIVGFPDARVTVSWKPSPMTNDTATWHIVAAKIAAGVPQDVALAETGLYDPAVIKAWLADPEVDVDITHRLTLLADLAAAVQGLGQGVALGIMDEADAKMVVQTVVGRLIPQAV
jgi:hypothetical protein